MPDQPKSNAFIPRETPLWFLAIGEVIFFPALFGVWGVATWATIELLGGNIVLGVILFAVWVPLFVLIAKKLHQRGRVRLGVSISTTLVLIVTVGVVWISL